MNTAKKKFSFEAIMFALYLFIAPIHQILKLGNGATINKYLALFIMVVIFITQIVKKGRFYIDYPLFKYTFFYIAWTVLSLLWSAEIEIVYLQSFLSYIFLFIIVSTKDWTPSEKGLFRNVIIFSCVLFAAQLIGNVGEMKRATIVLGDEAASKNAIAINVAFGAIIAAYNFLLQKTNKTLWLNLAVVMLISIGIICTGSRGGIISLVCSVLYLFFVLRKNSVSKGRIKIMSFCLILGIVFVLFTNILNNDYVIGRFTGEKNDTSGRIEIALQFIEIMNSKPYSYLIGLGNNSAFAEYKKYYNTGMNLATHNEYLYCLFNLGIVGLLLFLNLLFYIWRKSRSNGDFLGRACMILILLMMFSTNLSKMYVFWNALIFAYMGLGMTEKNEND